MIEIQAVSKQFIFGPRPCRGAQGYLVFGGAWPGGHSGGQVGLGKNDPAQLHRHPGDPDTGAISVQRHQHLHPQLPAAHPVSPAGGGICLPGRQPAAVADGRRKPAISAGTERHPRRRPTAGGSRNCWRSLALPATKRPCRPNCPAGNRSASPLPGPSPMPRPFCWPTSRRPASIRPTAGSSSS